MSFIFDTHAHYDAEQFDHDRDLVLTSLPQQGVCKMGFSRLLHNGWWHS